MGLAQLPVGHSKLRATLVGVFVVLLVVALWRVRVLTALDRILGH